MSSFGNPSENNLNIQNSVKQVFISQKNTGYLFDLIVSKILKTNPQYQPILFTYINTYKENIIQLQQLIFDDSFKKIYNRMELSGNIDFEEVLIELNKITVLKFEHLLFTDLTNKFTQPQQQQNQLQLTDNRSDYTPLQTNYNQSQIDYTHSEKNYALTKQANNDTYSHTSSENKFQMLSTEFFSENAVFENGKYTFLIKTNNIASINIDNFKIKCNLYNITENNNKFILIENGVKTDVIIPIGYYDITTLIEIISDCTNDVSINRNKDYFYKVFLNTFKNKICFLCDYVDKEKVTKPLSFGLSFYKSKNQNIPSLPEMLGFYKSNYTNNNLYVAEDFANTNVFDELYCKLYLDNMEVPKYKTTDVNFCFFEKINIDMDKSFGKTVFTQFDDNFYTFDNNLKAKNLSIKFYNDYNSHITAPLWFKCKISFEYI